MPGQPPTVIKHNDTNDIIQLVTAVRSCLALADQLQLPMVGIHLEQARAWLIQHGHDEVGFPSDIPDDTPPCTMLTPSS